MLKVKCPQCHTVSSLRDEQLGLKLRCKVCNTTFATARKEAVTTTSREDAGGVMTVLARRVGPGLLPSAATAVPRLGRGWVALAVAALLLPVLSASGFVAFRWHAGRAAAGSEARRGTLYAGVEIGSKGVKAVVVEVFPDPEFGYDLNVRDEPKSINTTLVTGLATKDRFDADALKDTARAVATLYNDVRARHAVPEDHIYIVGSSGLFSPLRKRSNLDGARKAALIKSNKETLAQAVRDVVGRPVYFIDAADEAERSFKGIVPRPAAADAVLYDIGSGNTKGAYAIAANTFDTLELPYGTTTYTEFVRKAARKAEPFAAEASRLSDAALRQPLRDQIGRKPGFRNRNNVFLSGGLVWALANHVHPGDRHPMVKLTTADLDAFGRMLGPDPRAMIEAALARLPDDDPARKKEAEKVLKKVHDTFSPDQLRGGLEVLRALSAEGEFEGKDKKLHFARYGVFGWLMSYVAEKGGG